MYKGIVVKSTGSWYQVLLENKEVIDCRIIGRFRLNGMKVTNPVAVGDRVELEKEADDKGIIKKIMPRENFVVRQSPRKKHYLHLLASNIDQAVIIMTIISPNLKQGFIDRFLLMTEPYNIPVIVVFNKADLYGADELTVYNYLREIYEKIGYEVRLVSSTAGTGLKELKNSLKDKITLISGQSGVGKSTLVNALQPNLYLHTNEISDYSGKGMHTTTFAEMFPLDFGGHIIDTPGIKTLGFNNLTPKDVVHNFRELFQFSKGCKFADCTHRNEPGCAVKEAVELGDISELRYINYVTILEEIEDQNYWERHKI